MPRVPLIGRRRSYGVVVLVFALLAAGEAAAAIHPSYEGLVYPQRPVADIPVFGGGLVDTLTGNLVLTRDILAVPARGVPVELFLVFNADRRHVSSPFGKGWTLSYNLRVVDDASGNVRLVWGDGRVDLFTASGGSFSSPPGVFATLSRPSPGVLELHSKHGMVFRFADPVTRKLSSITDPNGNSLTFTYDASGRLTTITDASGRQWLLEYDGSGKLHTIRDPNRDNRTWTFDHDGSGRLIAITDPLSHTEHFAYDGNDRPVDLTDRRGTHTTLTYAGASPMLASASKAASSIAFAFDGGTGTTTITDPRSNPWKHTYASGRLASTTDPLNDTAGFSWGADETLTAYTDPRGHTTTLTHDAEGNLTSVQTPLDASTTATTQLTYDATCNMPASLTDPRGNTWTFTRDAACNLTRIDDPASLGTFATAAYDAMGQPASATDRSGRTTTLSWDSDGDLEGLTDPLGETTSFEHSGSGRLTKVTDPLGHAFAYEYDALDRVIAAKDAYDKAATYDYDEQGRLLRFTDREGNQTQFAYDDLGRPSSTTDALGNSDLLTYDKAGNPTSYTDRRGHVWTATFDPLGRVSSRTNPLAHTWQYGFDPNGNLITQTDAKGQATTFTYDFANRLLQRDFADASRTSYSYDADSDLLSAVDRPSPFGTPTSNYSFQVDAGGRETRFDDLGVGRHASYTWDGDGRQLSETDHFSNTTTYTYDTVGRLQTLTAFGQTVTYDYDAAGNRLLASLSSGATQSFTYDDNERIASIVIQGPAPLVPAGSLAGAAASTGTTAIAPGGPVIASYTYTRDGNGDITAALRETAENVAFTRDPLRRIVEEQGTLGGVYTETQEFDKNGNRTTVSLSKPGFNYSRVVTVVFNDADLAASSSNIINGSGPILTYDNDANGARSARNYTGGDDTYTYNARNQLVSTTVSGTTDAYAYDALDRLLVVGTLNPLRLLYGSGPIDGMSQQSQQVSFAASYQPKREDFSEAFLTALFVCLSRPPGRDEILTSPSAFLPPGPPPRGTYLVDRQTTPGFPRYVVPLTEIPPQSHPDRPVFVSYDPDQSPLSVLLGANTEPLYPVATFDNTATVTATADYTASLTATRGPTIPGYLLAPLPDLTFNGLNFQDPLVGEVFTGTTLNPGGFWGASGAGTELSLFHLNGAGDLIPNEGNPLANPFLASPGCHVGRSGYLYGSSAWSPAGGDWGGAPVASLYGCPLAPLFGNPYGAGGWRPVSGDWGAVAPLPQWHGRGAVGNGDRGDVDTGNRYGQTGVDRFVP
jgi:YD repeat-containing protein